MKEWESDMDVKHVNQQENILNEFLFNEQFMVKMIEFLFQTYY